MVKLVEVESSEHCWSGMTDKVLDLDGWKDIANAIRDPRDNAAKGCSERQAQRYWKHHGLPVYERLGKVLASSAEIGEWYSSRLRRKEPPTSTVQPVAEAARMPLRAVSGAR